MQHGPEISGYSRGMKIVTLEQTLRHIDHNRKTLDVLVYKINERLRTATRFPIEVPLTAGKVSYDDFLQAQSLFDLTLSVEAREAGHKFYKLSAEFDEKGEFYSNAPTRRANHTYCFSVVFTNEPAATSSPA